MHQPNTLKTVAALDLALSAVHRLAGSSRIIELCLRKGAKINKRNKQGKTPLHLACAHPKIAKLLIKKGANMSVKDRNGENAVFSAVAHDFLFEAASDNKSHNLTPTHTLRGPQLLLQGGRARALGRCRVRVHPGPA